MDSNIWSSNKALFRFVIIFVLIFSAVFCPLWIFLTSSFLVAILFEIFFDEIILAIFYDLAFRVDVGGIFEHWKVTIFVLLIVIIAILCRKFTVLGKFKNYFE